MSVLPDRIAAIILAAGKGSRLGGGKLLLPWQGKPIVRHVLDAALCVSAHLPVIVIVGCDSTAVQRALNLSTANKQQVHVVENPEWKTGQSSSLRAGISRLMEAPWATRQHSAMILLGDQPLIKPNTLSLLANSHLATQSTTTPAKATAPYFNEQRGNPVILAPVLFPAIMKLRGDTGARRIIADLGDGVNRVDVDDPGVVMDVDAKEDYNALPAEPADL